MTLGHIVDVVWDDVDWQSYRFFALPHESCMMYSACSPHDVLRESYTISSASSWS
jgi:hypothetical protein